MVNGHFTAALQAVKPQHQQNAHQARSMLHRVCRSQEHERHQASMKQGRRQKKSRLINRCERDRQRGIRQCVACISERCEVFNACLCAEELKCRQDFGQNNLLSPFFDRLRVAPICRGMIDAIQWYGDNWNEHPVSNQLAMQMELQNLVLEPVDTHSCEL